MMNDGDGNFSSRFADCLAAGERAGLVGTMYDFLLQGLK